MPNDPEVPPVLQAVATETAKNAALKEAVKANAGGRASRAQALAPVPPPIPMPGDEEGIKATLDAASEYDSVMGTPAVDATLRQKLGETYRVYVNCRESHAPNHPPHGLYLVNYPDSGEVPYDGWYARYKKPDERYYPNEVLCQVCALENRSVPLQGVSKTSPEGAIHIEPRALMRVARDQKRAQIERQHRVFLSGYESVNGGRRDALARAKAAGYEVHDA